MINEARDLSTSEPYVKLYLSKDGADIKKTKQKTKSAKKTKSPSFSETFEFDISKSYARCFVALLLWCFGALVQWCF
jgi:hypothetical protein